jgi:hypothetical protein
VPASCYCSSQTVHHIVNSSCSFPKHTPSSLSSISLNYLDFLQARPLMTKVLEDGNHDALVDPRLGNEYNNNEMEKMIACAAACVRHSARRRPRMSEVHN